jgi:hypothetical protein
MKLIVLLYFEGLRNHGHRAYALLPTSLSYLLLYLTITPFLLFYELKHTLVLSHYWNHENLECMVIHVIMSTSELKSQQLHLSCSLTFENFRFTSSNGFSIPNYSTCVLLLWSFTYESTFSSQGSSSASSNPFASSLRLLFSNLALVPILYTFETCFSSHRRKPNQLWKRVHLWLEIAKKNYHVKTHTPTFYLLFR